MTVDDFTIHLPPHVRPEFVAWLAKRDAQTGLKAFLSGYDHGWHDGQQDNERIA